MSQTEEDILKSLGIGLPRVPTEESILNSMGVGLPRHPELQPAKTTIPQITWETVKGTLRDLLKSLEPIAGVGEAGMAGVTGLTGFVPSVATRIGARPFVGAEKADILGQKVAETLTYKPKTEAGQVYTEVAMSPFALLGEASNFMAEKMAPGDEGSQREIKLAFDTALLLSPLLKNYITNAIKSGKPISVEETAKIVEASKEIPIEQKAEFVATMKKAKTKRVLPKPEQAYEPTKRMPPTKTEQEAMLEQAEKLGTYPIRGFTEEPKTPIIKKGYPKEYIEKQNKILAEQEKVINAEADILKRTGKTEPEINAFLKNDFMDGEKLRETTNKVLAGEIKPEDAAKNIADWIDATTGKKPAELVSRGEQFFEGFKTAKAQPRIPKIPEQEIGSIRAYLEGKTPEEQIGLLSERRIQAKQEIAGFKEGTWPRIEVENEVQAIDSLLDEIKTTGKIAPIEKVGISEEVPTIEKPQGKIEAGESWVDKLDEENKKIKTPYEEMKKSEEGGFVEIPRVGKVEVVKDKLHQIYQDIFDKFHAIKRVSDIAKAEGYELPPGEDPYVGARLYAGVQGKAETKILYKRFKTTSEGKIIWGKEGLSKILEPVKGDIENFDRYLVYRRATELQERGLETGLDKEVAKKFVEKYKSQFESRAEKITEYMHSQLDELVASGRITPDLADFLKGKNKFYVKFERVMDDLHKYGYVPTSRNVFTKIPSTLYRMKGSKRVIISPIESAIKATYITTNIAERNRIANMIIDLRDVSPEIAKTIRPIKPKMKVVAQLEDGTKVWRPSVFQEKGVIEVWQKGKRHFYEVPKDLYDAMSQMTETGNRMLTKVLAIPARILRTGATTVPEFALRNPIRDQLFAFANAKYGYMPFVDFTRGLFEMIGKGEQYWRWKASGADWSQLVTLDRATNQKMLKQVLGHKDFAQYIKNPIKLLEDFSMYGEMPTRIGVFKKSLRKGVSETEAAMASREASIDFARRGLSTKVVSSLYTFLNARLQGLDQMVRTFKERPVETLAKTISIATIPSILNYFVNRDDRAYWEIPEWQRDLFWIIPAKRTKFDEKGNVTEKGLYLRVPKGDIGVVFGTTAEKVLAWMDRDKATKPELDKLMGQIFQQVSPIGNVGEVLPVAFRGLFEVMANKKFFVNRPIVPQGQEALEPKYQYTPFTSETSKLIGKTFNVSPAKIDHLITSYTAGLGRHGLKLNDAVLKEMGLVEKKPEVPKKLADYPVLQAFVVRDPMGFNSETIQNFYETLNKINRFYSTVSRLREQGKTDELKKLIKDHPVESVAVKNRLDTEFRRTQTDLAQMRKMRDIIYENKEMSSEEKGKVIDGLEQAGFRLAFITMMKYKYLETKKKND
jgi:hypothetical protein